jgi:hypothetical protein
MNLRSRSLLGSLSLAALLVPSIAAAQAGREGMRTISATNAVINRCTTLGAVAAVTADAMGNWSTAAPTGAIAMDGMVTITVSSRDAAENTANATSTITVDSRVVAISAPAMVMDACSEVRGIGEPGATITIVFDSGERGTVTVDAMGNWAITPTPQLGAGPHRVEVTARDRAGNSAV